MFSISVTANSFIRPGRVFNSCLGASFRSWAWRSLSSAFVFIFFSLPGRDMRLDSVKNCFFLRLGGKVFRLSVCGLALRSSNDCIAEMQARHTPSGSGVYKSDQRQQNI